MQTRVCFDDQLCERRAAVLAWKRTNVFYEGINKYSILPQKVLKLPVVGFCWLWFGVVPPENQYKTQSISSCVCVCVCVCVTTNAPFFSVSPLVWNRLWPQNKSSSICAAFPPPHSLLSTLISSSTWGNYFRLSAVVFLFRHLSTV